MRARLSIGDFSRMTHLTVKALRHYHEIGLLVPSEVDSSSGYRLYEAAQVRTAHVIRRLRGLGMPLDEIGAILLAPDVATRSQMLADHMRRKEAEIKAAQAVVDSLRALLDRPAAPIDITHRRVAAQPALAVTGHVLADELDAWWEGAFGELDAALCTSDASAAGPRAALYSPDFFELGAGNVTAYRPISTMASAGGEVELVEIAGAELAIAVHHGGFTDLDQTYGLLGTYVAEREIGMPGPIREHYVVCALDTDDESRHVTEVCWPVFQTRGAAAAAREIHPA